MSVRDEALAEIQRDRASTDAYRAAEHLTYEIREVARELRRVRAEGLPYNGPEIKWQAGNLAATRPEPHEALGAEYLDLNEDIDVDEAYIDSLLMAVTYESGYRERMLDEATNAL